MQMFRFIVVKNSSETRVHMRGLTGETDQNETLDDLLS